MVVLTPQENLIKQEEEKTAHDTLQGWDRYQNLGHILEAVEVIDDPNPLSRRMEEKSNGMAGPAHVVDASNGPQ